MSVDSVAAGGVLACSTTASQSDGTCAHVSAVVVLCVRHCTPVFCACLLLQGRCASFPVRTRSCVYYIWCEAASQAVVHTACVPAVALIAVCWARLFARSPLWRTWVPCCPLCVALSEPLLPLVSPCHTCLEHTPSSFPAAAAAVKALQRRIARGCYECGPPVERIVGHAVA